MSSPNTKRVKSLSYCDLYNTPKEALDKLMDFADLNKYSRILEPCAGKGVISEYLKGFGYSIETNEAFDHGYQTNYKEDFLKFNEDFQYDFIVSNPPYKIAKEFVLKGFKVAKEQYQLLRVSFLEGKSRYEDLFSLGHLKGIYLFTSRISCSEGVDELPTANAVCYAWLHFDREYKGNPQLYWI